MNILEAKGLRKTFHLGFFRKETNVLRGVDFAVKPGEFFGLLGPNGAGKTTTIKIALDLLRSDSGEMLLFGESTKHPKARQKIGYLPESPYIYRNLKLVEYLDFCGTLHGMKRNQRRNRIEKLVEQVGLGHATERPIGKFSKGMMQRAGLAQALLHDPSFLILDEPMSGLDPLGRKLVKDLLMSFRNSGKTVLLTSHILSDVEALCDRVAIMNAGRVQLEGELGTLLDQSKRAIDLEFSGNEACRDALRQAHGELKHLSGDLFVISLQGTPELQAAVDLIRNHGGNILGVTPQRASLEELFVSNIIRENPDKTQSN